MRISDWSSDVCSFDLVVDEVTYGLELRDASRTMPTAVATINVTKRATGMISPAWDMVRFTLVRNLPNGPAKCMSLPSRRSIDRKRVVSGHRVSLRVDLGVRLDSKKKTSNNIKT